MCGRYASARKKHELLEEFQVEQDGDPDKELGADYNVAPTKNVYAVLSRVPDQAQRAVRQLRVLKWGLVPAWAKDPSIGSRLINARAETLAEKPSYRRAFAKRRCLLPADGYFEWMPVEGEKKKQPYFIHPADGGVLAMAGLYEFWKDPSRGDDDPLKWLVSCTVITTDAEDDLGRIHDRMPMMIERDRWAEWLDPGLTDTGRASELLVPAKPGRLTAYAVSTDVNNVRNNGPHLIERLPEADEPALF
ncbi:SOS response-associated peptidase [Nonomuraea sp. KC401]|uniref:Abasic site processing protein n=1 Tax=Nonomuraea longispora TaxID=1848320 RepID=A0A4R4N7I6_9ACTN|nr:MULTISPECIES: SOS response-associated peptidase [Nonomuraea]NBE98487.1 SOS response-associated peptidase [Nonomuraea sp. K271]TDC03110.1 SOS response-associated peptidase [Nonomuraea longispora]TLF83238.1 SOS response-associated peptidase [Nonomuraea sp. KC401]